MTDCFSVEPIFGFTDADAWERHGNRILARARDSSYKEKVRSGLPIEYFLDLKDAEESIHKPGKPTRRPDFMEPEPCWCGQTFCDNPEDFIEYKYHEDLPQFDEGYKDIVEHHSMIYAWQTEKVEYPELFEEPTIQRRHRRSRGTTRRGKKPAHETKSKKLPARLGRGKVRGDHENPDKAIALENWLQARDLIVSECIWWELRHPGSHRPHYTYKDYDSIIRRFVAKLDPDTHPTSEHIRQEWQKSKSAILADYTPLKIEIPPPRYFNGSFYEDWSEDDWDWDWIDRHPLRLYL